MKKLLLGLGFALFCLVSCGDDDAAPAVNLENINKKWYAVSYKIAGQTIPYDGNLACGKDYLEFLANGTARDVDYYDCQEDPDILTGVYSAANETLITTIDDETITYTILKLNSGTLEIEDKSVTPNITYVYTSTP
ncbi:lipocalin family protein [Flavobacterium subsaxonicum]|uniref:Lipocalin-like domain-containing protein n=1 Tax=Flavobacterium subsaxonicum WB 4.1-42 = DSM 21790 TaxID=1121898 RepID=A0A0A2MFI5_9FLAO|nr:lipocalin family protein [Flavobacterium subsaxonicum]KGO91462.1 hypothetical protein Q766_17940 [Flavobacterium subsaxonicum WB 4.1-42 = DSM 21790]